LLARPQTLGPEDGAGSATALSAAFIAVNYPYHDYKQLVVVDPEDDTVRSETDPSTVPRLRKSWHNPTVSSCRVSHDLSKSCLVGALPPACLGDNAPGPGAGGRRWAV